MLRKFISTLAVAAVFISAVAGEEMILNIYNWSDYIARDTISKFEEKTGIKVNYDVFDCNEVLEAKLLAGNSGYDVVVPSAGFLERQIQAGVFAKLDKTSQKNYSNLDEEILQRLTAHDPGSARYSS